MTHPDYFALTIALILACIDTVRTYAVVYRPGAVNTIPGEPDLDSDEDHDDIHPTVNPQPPTAPDQQAIPSTIEQSDQQTKPATIQSVEQLVTDMSSMSHCGSPDNHPPLRDIQTPTVHHEAPNPVLSTLMLPRLV